MKRLQALDILRGLTVALMILVNNGAGNEIYGALKHSQWNGLTPCDLVFPFFLFMVGMSTYLSLTKTEFRPSVVVLRKIAKRTVLLFVIGLAINWFDMLCGGRALDFAHLRIWGVMQRIALCYGAVAVLAVTLNHRYFLHVIMALLVAYTGLLVWGNGYSYEADTNILTQVDRFLFGYDHLYHKGPVDPEGLLGTIPSIAHTMIGFWCCMKIQQAGQSIGDKISILKYAGLAMVVLGFALSLVGLGINKRIWSPSYVFVTCGFAAWLLGLLIQFIDRRKETDGAAADKSSDAWWVKLWVAFGVNPLFLYVASEVLGIAFGAFGIKDSIYAAIHSIVTDGYLASLVYAVFFVAIHAVMGCWLYRKRIFIKI